MEVLYLRGASVPVIVKNPPYVAAIVPAFVLDKYLGKRFALFVFAAFDLARGHDQSSKMPRRDMTRPFTPPMWPLMLLNPCASP